MREASFALCFAITALFLRFIGNIFMAPKGSSDRNCSYVGKRGDSNIRRRIWWRHIDFWSLDVEGGELEVLETMDFPQVSVGVIVATILGKIER
jgi:hypothetical protein